MRLGTGLGGEVIARAGGAAVLTPADEIYAALERGVIDAAEWVGPHDDMKHGPPSRVSRSPSRGAAGRCHP
jgi:TRAP-type mannitol/chloroaromatic compound transport system substrate-binding protein